MTGCISTWRPSGVRAHGYPEKVADAEVTIRPAMVSDAAGWSETVAACAPYLVQDERSTQHDMAADPPGTIRLVAEVAGEVRGIARRRDYGDEDHASALIMVRPDARGRGIGRTLRDELRLDATGKPSVQSIVEDDAASQQVAVHWGFELTRTYRMSAVDPTTLPTPEADERVRPLDTIDPHQIHALHNGASRSASSRA